MGTIETVETALTGHVAFKPNDKYIKGFPFRALHIVDPFNKYYDELTEAEHEQVNHRRKAVLAIADKIKEDLAHEEEEIVIETDL
jgi:inosine/xanthosine triphosphate pyrophosphatase family protein